MQSRFIALVAIVAMCCGATIIQAEELHKDRLIYVDKTVYPVMEEMKENDEAQREAAAAKTEEILATVTAENKARKDARRELRVDLSDLDKPAGPDAFARRSWHFPPTPQYRTGTCWSFATTSFMESEIHRLSGREIKLSEMWGAYWEYVLKARGFVQTRGESNFSQGSQSAALLRIYGQFGVVPRADYEGVLSEDGRFDHALMVERMSEFLDWCREEDFWDEEAIIGSIRLIMDATMGRPPEQVTWQGRDYTPRDFLRSVCDLDPADYVSLISTSSIPFWTRGEYAVPDNWWHDTNYLNVPLKPWFEALKATVVEGGSLVIGGDVSEPGLWGLEDVAIVPTFDIPGEYIDQDSREFRFVNRSSTDDHLIHIVGTTTVGDHDWFLIKDSNRSSRLGAHEGYYFYREDYVRLKMLMYTVHKDRVVDLLTKVDKN
jgi:bleomycin hydrolase